MAIHRGEIYEVDLSGAVGNEKANGKLGSRPCVIVQNDVGNAKSPLTIVVPLTDAAQYKKLPVQVLVTTSDGVLKDSVVECGHIRTVDVAKRVGKLLGKLSTTAMKSVDKALKVSLALS
ncbi:mRNA interferase MazF [Humidesulfovibrio mexicanus]|jgi:mRNA interferase MazF|uniref:mRNA interferase n=1 Tax=Humidesulfovibrio mexicanus TaxID=147047 RepID=A0A239CKJ2_9BACT|nr:type II toxin-antitoxin system PemK/MazF family toxin [Humidesulfovibrio mexicanus]SNS20677.1 mRNA interferase MazF [Humidesulfovibrio mexicanus]